MGSVVTLIRRELGVYFISPMAYIVMTAFLVATGYFFMLTINYFSIRRIPPTFDHTVNNMLFLIVFMTPLITMRLISEEKNRGTIETLMTLPVTELQVVLSKYLAAIIFYIAILIPSTLYAVIIACYSTTDFGIIIGSYLGLLLLGATLISIGIFISSLCANQISAGVITLIISILLIVIGVWAANIREQDSILKHVLSYIDLTAHTYPLTRGLVDTRDIIFMFSVIIFFLFLTIRAVESRRWR
jgi:ABC-2 type transport system permease protein